MEFMEGVMDYGTAPEIYVGGIERVALLSPGIVRVSMWAPYRSGQGHELRTVLHTLWDRERFISIGQSYDQARIAMAFAEGFRIVRKP